MTETSFFELSPYLCLLFSVIISLKGSSPTLALMGLIPALLFGFLNQFFDIFGLMILIVTPLSFFIWVNHYFAELMRKIGFFVFSCCALVLMAHQLPGLANLKIFDQLVFAPNSAPFNMYFNFDKVYLALVVFNFLPPLDKYTSFRASLFVVFKYFVALVAVLSPFAIGLGYLSWELKWNPYLLVWAVNNFFFVCFFEEVIFRRFLQNQLVDRFRNVQYGDLVAIFIGALLFGAAHFSGGAMAVGFACAAGIFYGLCFYHTCNVRSSMCLHFSVNMAHAIFFTYPFAL